MIHACEYFKVATKYEYQCYSGVPCSFLTPFINSTITNKELSYISAANEGDAVAIASGAFIGGQRSVAMMQNSGLGNAVNPLTSLVYTFRIPLLLIITLRGDPQLRDEPQHELMGKITGTLLESMKVPWEYFPIESDAIDLALARAEAYMLQEQLPYAFVMRKGSVVAQDLEFTKESQIVPKQNTHAVIQIYKHNNECHTRSEVLTYIIENTSETKDVIIATTGYTGRELSALADRPNHFYMVGSMGCASSLALGLSLARSDLRVIIIDGDGAAFMRMGNFATIGTYGNSNLIHILLDNRVHESTGGQGTTSSRASFAQIAAACGYGECSEGNSLELLHDLLHSRRTSGPCIGHLQIRPGTLSRLPRPELRPDQVCHRLMVHIGSQNIDQERQYEDKLEIGL